MLAGDAIRNLLGEYCERIDDGAFADVGALFAHGTLADEDGRVLATGAEAVADFYAAGTLLHGGSPRTRHLVTNTVLEVDEAAGTASARSSYLVLQQVDDQPLQPIITGRYHDAFEHVDGAWRFAERRFLVYLVGDLSRLLAYAMG